MVERGAGTWGGGCRTVQGLCTRKPSPKSVPQEPSKDMRRTCEVGRLGMSSEERVEMSVMEPMKKSEAKMTVVDAHERYSNRKKYQAKNARPCDDGITPGGG